MPSGSTAAPAAETSVAATESTAADTTETAETEQEAQTTGSKALNPPVFFLLDYLAIMWLLAFVAYGLGDGLKRNFKGRSFIFSEERP